MTHEPTQASLTRKLRQLIELDQITLTPEEADLFKIQTIDQLTFEELLEEKGDLYNE